MTFISEQILQAIDMLIEKRTRNLQFDKTVIGYIISFNEKENSYKVKYMDSNFIAYSYNGNKYMPGDCVYVKIPMNDFSNTKIIECLCQKGE